MEQESARDRDDERRPYQRPAVEESAEFEALALAQLYADFPTCTQFPD